MFKYISRKNSKISILLITQLFRYCSWRCKQVSALVCHERTHTNERPYSCSVCRQRFKYLGDKNKHERRHESLGGSGFKRIVPVRTVKAKEQRTDDSSVSEQDQGSQDSIVTQDTQKLYEEQQTQEVNREQVELKHEIDIETAESSYEQVRIFYIRTTLL